MAETKRERGERLFKEICGAPAAAADSEFVEVTINHIFGEVWARDDIANRDQRLLTIATLTTLGETEPLAIHMRMALDSGDLTEAELHGAVMHLAHYAGWPRGSAAFQVFTRVVAERNQAGEA